LSFDGDTVVDGCADVRTHRQNVVRRSANQAQVLSHDHNETDEFVLHFSASDFLSLLLAVVMTSQSRNTDLGVGGEGGAGGEGKCTVLCSGSRLHYGHVKKVKN